MQNSADDRCCPLVVLGSPPAHHIITWAVEL
jgi:hypothetical protein